MKWFYAKSDRGSSSGPGASGGLRTLDSQLEHRPAKDPEAIESGDKSDGTILVAEDNATFARLISALLENLGFQVHVSANGRELIESLRCHPACVAILMDHHMPVMGGVETVRRLRAGEGGQSGKKVPVICLTASSDPNVWKSVIAAGMNHYLPKTFLPEELLHCLREAGVSVREDDAD